MKVGALLSVTSSAVLVAALSSASVQLQPPTVLVATPPAPVVAAQPARVAVPPPAAVPARPAYVDVPAGAEDVQVRRVPAPAAPPAPTTVDVLACSRAWTPEGECPGRQVEVLRQGAVESVDRAVHLPADVPHLRVSASGGAVEVQTGVPAAPAVRARVPLR